jgi:nucleotide-binding universal stress UspA family protein
LVPLDGSKLGESALRVVDDFIVSNSKADVELFLLSVITVRKHWVTSGEAGVSDGPAGPVPYTEKEMEFIKTKATEYLKSVAEGLKKRGLKVTTEVRSGKADEEILKAIKDLDINVVAMSTHGRSGLSHFAFGSVAEKVLRQASVPVFTVRAFESHK